MVNFNVKSVPKVARIVLSTKESGIPPSSIPCGQIYLQKYGEPIPALLVNNMGSATTVMSRTPYFM